MPLKHACVPPGVLVLRKSLHHKRHTGTQGDPVINASRIEVCANDKGSLGLEALARECL